MCVCKISEISFEEQKLAKMYVCSLYILRICVFFIEILMCRWLQRKPESLQAGNSDRLISFPFSASASYCGLKLPGRCWSASQSLCIPEGLRLCISVSHFWNPSLWHLDLRTNTLGLCGTWIPWRWESLKYHHCLPRHCSESTALTTSESISVGSGPACINLNHPHPAKSLNSDWGRFLPGTTQPVPVKLHQGWIWLGTQGDSPPIHPSMGAAEILQSTLQRTIDVKWRRPSASSLSLKCCY